MTSLRPLLPALLSFSLLVPPMAAQQPAQPQAPPPAIKVDVDEVLVDIVVRDKKGKIIRDLKPEEIEITEDGAKQTPTALRLIEGREAISGADHIQLDPLRQLRLISLVFERLGPDSMRLARDAANELIKRESENNVYYAVFRLDPSIRVLQGFTRDRNLLRKAIETATSGTQTTMAQKTVSDQISTGGLTPISPIATNANPAATDYAGIAMQRAVDRMQVFLRDATTQMTGAMSLTSLLALVKGQQGLPGRKTAVYFSEGLWLDQNTQPFFDTLVGEANRTNFTFYNVDAKGLVTYSQSNAGAQDLLSDVARARDAAGREGGGVTTADMKASDTQIDANKRNPQQNLSTLAGATGGFLIADTNDFKKPMAQVTEDVWTYYETAYKPTNKNFDGLYRALQVKVNRPNTVVQSRIGYFALPPEFRDVLFPWEVPLLKSLSAAPKPAELKFRTHAFHFGNSQGLTRGVLDMEIPQGALNAVKDDPKGTFQVHFSIVALIKDPSGQVVRKFQRDVPYANTQANLASFQAGTFIYAEPFEIAPGKYTIEAAVMDRTNNKIGAVSQPMTLDVPGDGPAVSSLTMIRRVDPVQGANPGTDPFRIASGKVVPALDARIPKTAGSNIPIYLVVYGAKGGPKPELFLEFLKDGQAVAKLPAPLPDPSPDGSIPYVATIPAGGFPEGNWEVRATAVQAGKTSPVESVKFVIAAP